MRAVQLQLAGAFALGDPREGAQVGEADFTASRSISRKASHRVRGGAPARCRAASIEHPYPVGDEMAFARLGIVELAGQRGGAAAAQAVAHDQDLADFELGDREFERRRDAVEAAAGLIGRGERRDVAHDEHFAGPGIENLRRVDAAVGAGQDHDLGAWPSASSDQRSRSCAQSLRAKAAITFDQSFKYGIARGYRGGQGWQAGGANRYLAAHERTRRSSPRQRKPDWIRVKAPVSEGYHATRRLMRELNLATVCEEAACPNIGECWTKKHATVMILGDTCTRACAFCNVKTGMPRAVDPLEPEHVATAAAELGLEHIVVTSVDRDDLPDGGAKQFVKVIEALRTRHPFTTIEILTPDFRNKSEAAVEEIVAAGPDVYNHNLETVPRLYPTIRPGARYYASLRLLESVKRKAPHIFTKSGRDGRPRRAAARSAPGDGRHALGRRRFPDHGPVPPADSAPRKGRGVRHAQGVRRLCGDARAKGFLLVAASPLTRSSYHAGDDFKKMHGTRWPNWRGRSG